MKKVMIAAGGTGGHIYPALALADTIVEKDSTCKVCFFGSSNRMEAELIPNRGYPFYGIQLTDLNGGIFRKIRSTFSLARAIQYSTHILLKEKPDVCVGFGNYISVPLILAAKRLHIPTMIHEQNSYAGKANKMLARVADAIVGCYETNLISFPIEKTKILGNPEATLVSKIKKNREIISEYGFDPNKPFVVFMMGSLGSSSVSEIVDQSCIHFNDFQVLIVTGKANEYPFTVQQENVCLVPYVEGAKVLQVADLAVTRAGATTLAEITALGVPTILIPSPYVPNNHQVQNALELVRKEAALMLEEKDLTVESLSHLVNETMKNEELRSSLSTNALKLGKIHAADEMITWLEEMTKK
ncbi:MAG: undecaprenyldiphospho-muramoylpentapeptide beta-N-acetylglucosaminyltransferase [Solobacterium sp.]|nr:undecaprenyldiphospho-muramoylpentapeptide beta-N-acetylglucosaminyltransferase [Solobacterium sp.]